MIKNFTFEEAMASYKLRSDSARRVLRQIASQRLSRFGAEEVGSSDINHELCAMCNEYQGDWDQCYFDALDEFACLR